MNSNNNSIHDNTVKNNLHQNLYLRASSYNEIYDNILAGTSVYGIRIETLSSVNSNYNIIRENNITDNSYSIRVVHSGNTGNEIYYNNINSVAKDQDGNNVWDDGTCAGNYWAETCTDTNPADGFCDPPHPIFDWAATTNTVNDSYPLANAWPDGYDTNNNGMADCADCLDMIEVTKTTAKFPDNSDASAYVNCNGITCTVQQDITFCANGIRARYDDNVIVDGNSHTITGSGSVNTYGVQAYYVGGLTVKNFADINNFDKGIGLGNNCIAENNTITSKTGVRIGSNNIVRNNVIDGSSITNSRAVDTWNSSDNTIIDNEFRNNYYGVHFYTPPGQTSQNNVVARNDIQNTGSVSIFVPANCINNEIYYNNIDKGALDYAEAATTNVWDDGVCAGNHWETAAQTTSAKSGYLLDNYPLALAWPDGYDNNSNGMADCAECTDNDVDGYAIEGGACGPIDCNDNNAAINPGASEICGNHVDEDCDGFSQGCAATEPTCAGTFVTELSDDFTGADNTVINDEITWNGRYALPDISAVIKSNEAELKSWRFIDTVSNFNHTSNWVRYSAEITDNKASVKTHPVLSGNPHGGFGVNVYFENGIATVYGNNLGYAPQMSKEEFNFSSQTGALKVEIFQNGVQYIIKLTRGTQSAIKSWTASRTELANPSIMRLGYFGHYDNAVVDVCKLCVDNDGDGYGAYGGSGCTYPGEIDCDDDDNETYPGAEELCDGKDNNCVNGIDETLCGNETDADCDTFNDCDGSDKCVGLSLPSPSASFIELKPNHYNISTQLGFGCTCEEVLYCKPGGNNGEYKWGCSQGTKNIWEAQYEDSWAPDCQAGGVVTIGGEAKDFFEDTDNAGMPDILDGDNDNDGVGDGEDDMVEDSDPPGTPGYGKPDWWERKKGLK
jgi:parallel beta-helix repeat protein